MIEQRALNRCNLMELSVRHSVGLDFSALNHPSHSVGQGWGLAMQKNLFSVGGFYFLSRFTGRRCLVLFDRPPVAQGLFSNSIKTPVEIPAAIGNIRRNQIKLV